MVQEQTARHSPAEGQVGEEIVLKSSQTAFKKFNE
jgi:hypothetical protein